MARKKNTLVIHVIDDNGELDVFGAIVSKSNDKITLSAEDVDASSNLTFHFHLTNDAQVDAPLLIDHAKPTADVDIAAGDSQTYTLNQKYDQTQNGYDFVHLVVTVKTKGIDVAGLKYEKQRAVERLLRNLEEKEEQGKIRHPLDDSDPVIIVEG